MAEADKTYLELQDTIRNLSISDAKKQQLLAQLEDVFKQELDDKLERVKSEEAAKFEKAVEDIEKEVRDAAQKYEVVNVRRNKVLKEKQHTEAILKALADGVIVMNNKGEPLMMNPAAEKLLGIDKKQQKATNILKDSSQERVVSFLSAGSGKEGDIQLTGASEETKKILKQSRAVIQDEAGRAVGMVSVLTDVTKQRELNALKDQFVANVSHELRTPLHCVRESVGLLLEKIVGDMNEEQTRVLTLAQRNLERLTRLINDLLDFAKLEAGEFKLKITTFEVNAMLKSIKESFDAWAGTKSIKIDVRLPDGDPIRIEADQDKVNQVLANLMGNAMKYTPESGHITVSAQLAQRQNPAAPAMVEFCVEDSGPGIPKEEQTKIFEKFVQAKTTKSARMKGTGLGLAISKEIIELHGGQIWVESEEEMGSKFYFQLPQKSSQTPIA